MSLIPVEEIGQELQGGVYIRVGPEGLVGSPFLQVDVRAPKREETGHVKAWGRGKCQNNKCFGKSGREGGRRNGR